MKTVEPLGEIFWDFYKIIKTFKTFDTVLLRNLRSMYNYYDMPYKQSLILLSGSRRGS